MFKEIRTSDAPQAVGPYSQAVLNDNMLFLSGQIPIDPASGKLVDGGIEAQAAQVLRNLEALLKAAGMSFSNVIRSEVFMKDLNDFAAMNKLYAEKFSQEIKPVRQTIQVAKLPMDALIEISCIAIR
ncbi:MAG: Rid family detoxifying hydrolase [Candidatus Margulisiibacteriota bacterium]|jgi:2-iminobutanoate/2-iminopropanoate deaminase